MIQLTTDQLTQVYVLHFHHQVHQLQHHMDPILFLKYSNVSRFLENKNEILR